MLLKRLGAMTARIHERQSLFYVFIVPFSNAWAITITSNLQQSWGAEVSKRERDYRKEWCVVDFCTRHACASVERHFSECTNSTNQAGISTSLYFSIEISTFSKRSYWNLYFLLTFLLKSLLSLYFSIEISTFSWLSYWNLYFLFTFLLSNPSASNVPILTHALKTPMSLNRFNIDVYTIGLERRWPVFFHLHPVLLDKQPGAPIAPGKALQGKSILPAPF